MLSAHLRYRLEIQAATEAADSTGELIKSWATQHTVWGGVDPLQGREYEAAKQVKAEVTHKITLRYLAGVTTQHRIKWGARIFHIAQVLNVGERNHELALLAIEEV